MIWFRAHPEIVALGRRAGLTPPQSGKREMVQWLSDPANASRAKLWSYRVDRIYGEPTIVAYAKGVAPLAAAEAVRAYEAAR